MKNLIPNSTINTVVDEIRNNGLDAGLRKFQESNWYKNLTPEQQNNITLDNYAAMLLESAKANQNIKQEEERAESEEKININSDFIKSNKENENNMVESLEKKLNNSFKSKKPLYTFIVLLFFIIGFLIGEKFNDNGRYFLKEISSDYIWVFDTKTGVLYHSDYKWFEKIDVINADIIEYKSKKTK